MQSENMGLLVQELLRISKWQQQSFNQACDLLIMEPVKPALLIVQKQFSPKKERKGFPACFFQEKSLQFPNKQG